MKEYQKNTAIFVAYDDYRPFDPTKPEKSLLRAILASALADYRKGGELQKQAEEYLLSEEDDYIFSFRAVCNFLDVDPERILVVTGLKESLNELLENRSSAPVLGTEQSLS
ncbi:MAG: hypothetical protein KDD64_04350 [Bdellovibrionales bacterium]|nr:hypothetical protein [Bdellovibrionales bacterium]